LILIAPLLEILTGPLLNSAHRLLRCLTYFSGTRLAAEVAKLNCESFDALLGAPCDDSQFRLSSLPVRKGGLGLTDLLTTHPAVFLSAAASFAARHQEDLPPSFWYDLKAAWTTVSQKYKLENPLFDQLLLAPANGEGKPLLGPRLTKQHECHSIISTQTERDCKSTACLLMLRIRAHSIARKPTDARVLPYRKRGVVFSSVVGVGRAQADANPWVGLGPRLALPCHYLGLYSRRNALRNEFTNLCKEARRCYQG
jgi:hypothetical protein